MIWKVLVAHREFWAGALVGIVVGAIGMVWMFGPSVSQDGGPPPRRIRPVMTLTKRKPRL